LKLNTTLLGHGVIEPVGRLYPRWGKSLFLKGVVRTTLVALALTAAAVAVHSPPAEQRSEPVAQEATPPQENPPKSESPPTSALGGMAAYLGRTVQSIDFPEIPKSEWPRLLELIPQKTGQPLDRDRIRDSILALHDTGRFGDLRVEAERSTEGNILLHFVTASNYFVGEINVEGSPAHPAANQVANAAKLQLGELFTRDKVSRAVQKIYQLMQENGYYQSTINEEELKHPETQQVDINLHISPGPQAHVGTIAANGSPGYSIGQIEDIGKIHPGDAVTAQRITNALDRLRKRYQKQNRLLAQVALFGKSYRPEVNAVDYVFDINPGPRVEIVTEGFKISHGVLKKNVPVYEENALDDDLLAEGRRNLLNFVQTRGYFDAKVTVQKRSGPQENELRVIYIVDAGPRHKLVKVEITGNKFFSDDQLRSRMQVQPAGRFLTHGRYSQALLNADIRLLEENPYRYNGFDQITITPTVIDNYEGRENELAVKLQINEGPQTLAGKVSLLGNTTTLEDPMPPLNISPGQGFSQTRIAEDREIILNYYFNHGFPDASFEASAHPASDANHMDVTFTIHEGKRVFVDQVFVSGLNYTRPFVLQREIAVKAGDPLSQIDMLNTQKHLYDLGIFSQVDTAIQNPEGNEREKNVLVDVQEAKRYTFNYGLGLEFQTGQPAVGRIQPLGQTGVSPRVSFSVTRLNFRGRDHTITFKANAGRLQQRGLLSYEAPRWFNSRDWRLTFTTFYDNTVDVATFTSERLEGSVQAEQTLSKSSVINYRMTFRRVLATNVAINSNLIPLLSQPTRVGMPSLSYIRNKRDSDLETTKGNYTTFDGGVADSHFGSEADFSRLLFQNSTYHAFGKNRPQERKFVLARSVRIGIENVFGNTYIHVPQRTCVSSPATKCPPAPQLIPLPERFFSGGGNSHRGFGLNQAGPRDLTSGFPLGGSALFLNNLELRMPPPTLPFFQENLSFAIFHDAGNVFTDGHDMLHNLLRWSQKNAQACLQQSTASQCDFSYISHAIGVGVRYKTPIGPVRFDFGYNLNPPAFPSFQTNSATNTQTFVPQHASHFNVFFSIGQTF
jgi:outer membrane protein insertion porin family